MWFTYQISIASVQQYCSQTRQFSLSGGNRLHFSRLIIFEMPFSTLNTVSSLIAAFPRLVGGSAATSTGQTTTQLPQPEHLSSSSLIPVVSVDWRGATISRIFERFVSNPDSRRGGQSSGNTSPKASFVAKAMHVFGSQSLQLVFGRRLYNSIGFSFNLMGLRCAYS